MSLSKIKKERKIFMEYNYLGFDINIGKSKPENIVHREVACPFCDVKSLKNIIEIKNDMILLENKYQVLQEAYQLLIIEGSECNADIPDYTLEHMQELMHFSINHWLNIINSKNIKQCFSSKIMGLYLVELCAIHICKLWALKI